MTPLKDFEEYVRLGIVKKQSPNLPRTESINKDSDRAHKVLLETVEKIGIDNENANYIIKNAYDIIMELIRAKMLSEGFNCSGEGAHVAEVSYLKKLGFSDNEVRFTNQLRYFRNGIVYYGEEFSKEYAEKVIDFINKIKKRLR